MKADFAARPLGLRQLPRHQLLRTACRAIPMASSTFSTTTCACASSTRRRSPSSSISPRPSRPAGDTSGMSAEDRNSLVILKRWAQNPTFLQADVTFCLIAENRIELNLGLVQNPGVASIEIPLPVGGRSPRLHPRATGCQAAARRVRCHTRIARRRSPPDSSASSCRA